jgi:hypothetical protein
LLKYVFISVSASNASSENKNHKREIGSLCGIERQASAEHADLVFKYVTSEIGCVEIGLEDHGPKGTKELNEKKIKAPRMMRNFCSRILEQYKTKPTGIKAVSIIISGMILTRPKSKHILSTIHDRILHYCSSNVI